MSSIEPDQGGGEMDAAEGVPGSFVVAGCDGAELLELGEEVLDEMARLVEVLVVVPGDLTIGLGRDDACLACLGERLAPLLPNKPRGVARVDDRRVISGIVVALQSGGRWIDVPAEYGPRKTLYNRFVRWSAKGVWQQVFTALGSLFSKAIAVTTLKQARPPYGTSDKKALHTSMTAATANINIEVGDCDSDLMEMYPIQAPDTNSSSLGSV